MSGSPVFCLGNISDAEVLSGNHNPKPYLVGLLVGYHSSDKMIVATQIQPLLKLIQNSSDVTDFSLHQIEQ